MKSIVLLTLSLFLGTFFIFIGSLKVTQLVHREMHREIRRNFIQYTKVFPLNDKIIGFKMTPKLYRIIIGYLEIFCGCLLIVLPNSWRLKNISTIVLIASNLLSLYTHYKLNNKFERLAPSIVFSLMLTCRLIVYLQVRKRIENQDKAKEREERRKLIERGEFDLDQDLSLSATDEDENESIDDMDDEELERLIKLSRKIHKQKKMRNLEKEQSLTIGEQEDSTTSEMTLRNQHELSCVQESKLELLDELPDERKHQLLNDEETKKII